MKRFTWFVAVMGFAVIPACSAPDLLAPERSRSVSGAGEPVALVRLRSEPFSFTYASGLTDSARVVVRHTQQWTDLWNSLWSRHFPQPVLPDVDFSRDMLVVAALGTRPTGGYGPYVDSAYQRTDHLEVVVRKVAPGTSCVTTQAITQPVDVARLPRSDQRVRYRERSVVVDCG